MNRALALLLLLVAGGVVAALAWYGGSSGADDAVRADAPPDRSTTEGGRLDGLRMAVEAEPTDEAADDPAAEAAAPAPAEPVPALRMTASLRVVRGTRALARPLRVHLAAGGRATIGAIADVEPSRIVHRFDGLAPGRVSVVGYLGGPEPVGRVRSRTGYGARGAARPVHRRARRGRGRRGRALRRRRPAGGARPRERGARPRAPARRVAGARARRGRGAGGRALRLRRRAAGRLRARRDRGERVRRAPSGHGPAGRRPRPRGARAFRAASSSSTWLAGWRTSRPT